MLEYTNVSTCTTFLDARLWIRPDGTIGHDLFIKPSALGVPLGHDSMHPDGVHMALPLGQVVRYKGLASSYQAFAAAVRGLIDALGEHSPGHPAVAQIERVLVARWQSSVRNHTPDSRITLPWHPALRRLAALAGVHNVGIAWRLGGMHLSRKLVSLSPEVHSLHSQVWWHDL